MTELTKPPHRPLAMAISRRAGLAAIIASTIALIGVAPPAPAFAQDKKAIKVGIISGEDEDVWRVVTAQAAEKGLTIETVVFNDYTQPNEALERGEIDANAFQHQPYLDNQIKTQGYHIVRVGYTGVWPIGLYSRKYSKVANLPEGAVIGVPNDPSNEGRALRVLQNEGLIKLKDGTGILAQEPVADNPYRNFIAVKAGAESEPWVKTLVESYQNDTVKAEFERVYKGTGLSAY
jgi:D-methionine transport system substrate-binding protein